ncbi:MAG TPA: tetratricopeptide repeat protein, partial [Rhodanobacteraceae bacterium]
SRSRLRVRTPPTAASVQPPAPSQRSGVSIALTVALITVVMLSAGLVWLNRPANASRPGAVEARATANQAANRFYLRGRQRMEARDRAGLTLAVADFREAVARDPGFARAYAGLSDAHSLMGYYRMRPGRDAFEAAREAAMMALTLDDTLAEAHVSLAGLLAYYDWDWAGGEREYRRAIDLDPSFAPARHWYANCLSLMGRHDEAIEQARQAVALQPLSLITLTGALGNAYVQAGHDDQAVEQFRAALEFDQKFGNAHAALALVYWRHGRLQEARQEMAAAASLGGNPNWAARVAALDAALGQHDDARRQLAALQRDPDTLTPVSLATVYLQLGDREHALEILERAIAARDPDLPSAKTEPGLSGLRTDVRFEAILRRMNLL